MHKQPLFFLSILSFSIFTVPGIGMEKQANLYAKKTEQQKNYEYQNKLYFVRGVSRLRAKTYFLQLCEDQLGFAQAVNYCSAHKGNQSIKPLETFLRRFTTEAISRAIILRNPKLREHEYGNECKSAVQGLEMSECYLYYLKTGETEGRLTKREWYLYWGTLERLKIDITGDQPSNVS